MTFDSGLVTILTLALAAAGVFATFVAPRLGNRVRLSCEPVSFSRIGPARAAGDVSVEVRHRGQLLETPVFSVRAVVENTGSRDVTRNEFVDPIFLRAIDGFSFVFAEASAPEGVNPIFEAAEHEASLTWSILKPGEKVSLNAIVQSNGVLPENDKIVRFVTRLRDVKVAPKADVEKYFRISIYGIFPIIIMSLILFNPTLWQTADRLYANIKGVEYQIIVGNGQGKFAELCPISKFGLGCRETTLKEFQSLISTAYLKPRSPFSSAQGWIVILGALSAIISSVVVFLDRPRRKQTWSASEG